MLSRFYGWLVAAGMALLAVAGALVYRRGKAAERQVTVVDQVKQQANTANAILKRNEVRQHVDVEVAALPANPVEPAAAGPGPVPGSAADRLQRDWSRD